MEKLHLVIFPPSIKVIEKFIKKIHFLTNEKKIQFPQHTLQLHNKK